MDILKQVETDFGTIQVMRSKSDGSLAYFQDGTFHSQSTWRGISICAYVHVMHEIVRQARARRVLIIGCAGGTLATMLRRLGCKVTVVDLNPMAFVIARRYFRMPEDVRCVRRDGIAYLRTTKRKYDAVLIDVFGSHNTVPRPFKTEAFFRRLHKVLSPSGVMVMNVITANDRDRQADSIAINAQAAGMDIQLFDWPRQKDRNTLIAGDMSKHTRIPSGKEPTWMKEDMHGLIRRRPRKRWVE